MKKLLLLLTLIPLNLMANSENQLTLYFIPSPIGIDWSTPSSLAWTAMKNRMTLQSRFMGHVFVEVQCNTENKSREWLVEILII